MDIHSLVPIEQGVRKQLFAKFSQKKNGTYYLYKREKLDQGFGAISEHFTEILPEKLKPIGITGTNAKTSVSTLLFDVFEEFNIHQHLFLRWNIVLVMRFFLHTYKFGGSTIISI